MITVNVLSSVHKTLKKEFITINPYFEYFEYQTDRIFSWINKDRLCANINATVLIYPPQIIKGECKDSEILKPHPDKWTIAVFPHTTPINTIIGYTKVVLRGVAFINYDLIKGSIKDRPERLS